MAKRPTRSEADEVRPPRQAPKPRNRARGSKELGPADPSEDEIRARAYQMYLERGGGHGMDFDDWLRAEQELKNRRGNW